MSPLVLKRIEENEKLIYKIARKYSDYYGIDDLYQAGCIGIMKADKNYKENDNTKFSTYAYKYILGEMIDFIRKDKTIIISEESYNIYRKYINIKELLCRKYNREVSFDEICEYMQIDNNYLLSIIESISFVKSINEDEKVYNSIIYNDDIDTHILIQSEIDNLNDLDKSIIKYRYFDGYSQMETAEIMGLSQSKVSREEKLVLKKIKDNITN